MSFFILQMRHIGQETLHKVYMRRFKAYLGPGNDPASCEAMEVEKEKVGEEEEENTQLFLCEKGRCERLFTETVCLKVRRTPFSS
jgi:hypothetical protein